MWVDIDVNGELVNKGRQLGKWRAIIDLSEAMKEDLGENLCAYSEKELRRALRKKAPLKYFSTDAGGERSGLSDETGLCDGLGHVGLSSRKSSRVKLAFDKYYAGAKKLA